MFNRGIVSRFLAQARKISLNRFSSNSGLSLAVLLFAVLLTPVSGWATTTKNCPTEPASTTVVSGETYSGTNCVLKTTGDIDSFTFTAAAGDIWSMVVGFNGSPATNICMSLYAPNSGGTAMYHNCTDYPCCGTAVTTNQKLTIAGTYTIDVSESTNATMPYDLSLERISPAPTDASLTVLAKNTTGQVSPPTAQEAYLFAGVTTGTYQITASMLTVTANVCIVIYQPDGTAVGSGCTDYPCCGTTTSVDLAPAINGTYVIVVYAAGDDGTVNYNLEVSCLTGTCKQIPLTCALTDALSYNATTGLLTMNFNFATPVAAMWNGWLVSRGTTQLLWSQSEPVTEPAVTVTKTQASVAKSGVDGVLSTLTTSTGGIRCSSWALVNTK